MKLFLQKKKTIARVVIPAVNISALEVDLRAAGADGLTARGYAKRHSLDAMSVLKGLGELLKQHRRNGMKQEWVPCNDFAIQQGRYWFQKDDNA